MWAIAGLLFLAFGFVQGQNNLCDEFPDGTGILGMGGLNNCRSYIHCVSYKPVLRTCAGGTFFNPDDRTCNITDINCQQRDIPSIIGCMPGVQAGTNCNEFVFCDGNTTYWMFCGSKTMYDNNQGICVHNDEELAAEQQCTLVDEQPQQQPQQQWQQ